MLRRTMVGTTVLALLIGTVMFGYAAKTKTAKDTELELQSEGKKKTTKKSSKKGGLEPLGASEASGEFTKKIAYNQPLKGTADWSAIKEFASKKYGKGEFKIAVMSNSNLHEATIDLTSVVSGRKSLGYLLSDDNNIYIDIFTADPTAKKAQFPITVMRFDFGPADALKKRKLEGHLEKIGNLTSSKDLGAYAKNLKSASKSEKAATIKLTSADLP